MVDPSVVCEELESIIERHMNDVSYVEALRKETAMIVHFFDGGSVLIEVSDYG